LERNKINGATRPGKREGGREEEIGDLKKMNFLF
jgi:hypothetical protein